MKIACVLRSGGDFKPEHVRWLAKQVPGLVCLSDLDVKGVETIQMQYDWPGWWSKMEMFSPLLDGNVLMIDLDTVILNLPDEPKETTVLRDFTMPELMGSGLMYVTAEDRARVWAEWIKDPQGNIKKCQSWPRYGDGGFLQEIIGDSQKWQDIDIVLSYKEHCKDKLKDGAKVVCFHGLPRPWQIENEWVPRLEFSGMNDFRELILKHKGKKICVMGGAPSLEEDLKSVEADIYISANAHGVEFIEPDYIVAMDERHSKHNDAPMGDWLRAKVSAPIISPHSYADYRLGHWPQHPRFVLSGMIATWAAWAMGAKVVILAGFDAYGGDDGYINEARKIAHDVPGNVRVVSGCLQQVWPAYDKAEKLGHYKPHPAIEALLGISGMIKCRVNKPTKVGLIEYKKGDIFTGLRHEVSRLIKHRMMTEI